MTDRHDRDVALARTSRQINNCVALDATGYDGLLIGALLEVLYLWKGKFETSFRNDP